MQKKCDGCTGCEMSLSTPPDVPYIAHESAMARLERNSRRQWIVIIILIAVIVLSNAAWIWYESQFEEIEQTVTQDVVQEAEDGTNNFSFVGGDVDGNAEGQDNYNH